MNFITYNPLIYSAFMGMLLAQLAKVILILLLERRLAMDRLTETGGMPSSHSAAVAALATSCGIQYGVGSPYFAIAIVFGSIVIYDATGVRRAAGRHAEILNSLITDMSHLFEEGDKPKALKTLLGHTYPQVLMGTILGVLVGFACMDRLW
jgi:acid phosphatase family membrane protein YuiD